MRCDSVRGNSGFWGRRGAWQFRFGPASSPDRVSTDVREDAELCGFGFLGLAVLAFLFRAEEPPVDENVIAFVKRLRDGLAETVERHGAVAFGFRLPLVV